MGVKTVLSGGKNAEKNYENDKNFENIKQKIIEFLIVLTIYTEMCNRMF